MSGKIGHYNFCHAYKPYMGSTPGGIFKKIYNPHLVPLLMESKKATKKKIDKLKKYFFPKINMLLQATYFSTINPQFVGLLTHILL
jgi:hypothetical protein